MIFKIFIIVILTINAHVIRAQGGGVSVRDLDDIEGDMNFSDDFFFNDAGDDFAFDSNDNFTFDEPAGDFFSSPDEQLFPQGNFNNDLFDFQNEQNLFLDDGFRTMEDDSLPVVQQVEQPNLFAGAPPIPGTLRIMAIGEAPEEYRIRKGDTLFDICDQLIDEASYWPKLWALNPYIRNPHFIYPGMTLRFYPGDDESPPFLQVVTDDDLMPVDKGGLSESELVGQDISGLLTRYDLSGTPVIGAEEVGRFAELDEAFIIAGSIFSPRELKVIIPVFVFESRVTPLATVVGGTSGSFLIDRDQDVVVRHRQETLPNTAYTIVRFSHRISHPSSGSLVGYRYEFVAQVEIKQAMAKGTSVGTILLNQLGAQPGDMLIPYRTVRRTVPVFAEGRPGSGERVVGFEYPSMELGGRGSFVLLETRGQTVNAGDTLFLFQDVRKAASSFVSDLPSFRKRVGKTHIIETFPTAVLGYILQDITEVRIGDDTGAID